ncbi:MAG: hypothetical protein ACUVS4_14555 [Chloroflexaceae bacterium]
MSHLTPQAEVAQNVPPHPLPLDMEVVLEQVLPIVPYGKDEAHLTLAALIEAQGINDSMTQSYGAANVFDLADRLLATAPPPPPPSRATVAPSGPLRFVAWWRCLLIGPAQASVMVLILGIIALAETGLHAMGIQRLTTVVATIVTTMIAGGSLQLGAWLIGVAIGRGMAHSLRLAYRRTLLVGLGITGAIALISLLVGQLANLEPQATLGFASIIVILTPLLLASGALMLLQRRVQTIGTLAVALGSLWVATMAYAAPLLITATSVLLIATIALVVQAEFEIWRRDPTMKRRYCSLPPPVLIWLYAAPFVCYGVLTVMLVFAAQPLIWMEGDILSRGPVHLMHLAGLSIFVLSQGAFEAGMLSLWSVSNTIQHQFTLVEANQAGKSVRDFILMTMRRALLLQFVLSGVLSPVILWLLTPGMHGLSWGVIGLALSGTMVGYALLGHALFICGVLNIFGNRWSVVKALSLSVVVTGSSARLALEALSPLASVAGIVLGGLLLFIVVAVESNRLLSDSAYTLHRGFS